MKNRNCFFHSCRHPIVSLHLHVFLHIFVRIFLHLFLHVFLHCFTHLNLFLQHLGEDIMGIYPREYEREICPGVTSVPGSVDPLQPIASGYDWKELAVSSEPHYLRRRRYFVTWTNSSKLQNQKSGRNSIGQHRNRRYKPIIEVVEHYIQSYYSVIIARGPNWIVYDKQTDRPDHAGISYNYYAFW